MGSGFVAIIFVQAIYPFTSKNKRLTLDLDPLN